MPPESEEPSGPPPATDKLTQQQWTAICEDVKRHLEASKPYEPTRPPETRDEEILSRLD
jgi:hypothetical protein